MRGGYGVGVMEYQLVSADSHVLTTINEHFDGVPDDERHAILAGNALRIYGQEVSP